MAPGTVAVTLERGETLEIVKEVPAPVCEVCGECYLDRPTSERVLVMAEEMVKKNAELDILRFAAGFVGRRRLCLGNWK